MGFFTFFVNFLVCFQTIPSFFLTGWQMGGSKMGRCHCLFGFLLTPTHFRSNVLLMFYVKAFFAWRKQDSRTSSGDSIFVLIVDKSYGSPWRPPYKNKRKKWYGPPYFVSYWIENFHVSLKICSVTLMHTEFFRPLSRVKTQPLFASKRVFLCSLCSQNFNLQCKM